MFTITSGDLTTIDQILKQDGILLDGQEPPWFTSVVLPEVGDDLRSMGAVGMSLLPPLRPRSKYERTEWVAVRDPKDQGKLRLVPELYLRALIQFGSFSEDKVPVWTSKDSIQLVTRARVGETLSSEYGFPAGSKEYTEAYRKKNKDKVREASRRYAARQRHILREAKKHLVEPLIDSSERVDNGVHSIAALAERFGLSEESLKKAGENG